jgi:hypothetical protein
VISLLIFLATIIPTSATIPALSAIPDTTAPTIPILILPLDHSTLDNSSPEFVWRESTDPNGNTVIYTLYLDGVPTYQNISNLGNSTTPNYTTRLEGDTLRLTPTYALPDGAYSWYVVASDPSLNTSRSATWRFTLDISLPPLTATISNLRSTTYNLSSLIYLLLAICILLLLAFLAVAPTSFSWLAAPHSHATIYHSLPYTPGVKGSHTPGVLSIIHNSSYKLYIPHLSRYSTLTIRTDHTVTVLSISVKQKVYTIVI